MMTLLGSSLLAATQAARAQQLSSDTSSAPLAIVRVTVIDPATASVRPEQTVVIDRGRIVAVDNFSTARVPPNARVVNAHGKFLIPGLWDMHVHWWHQEDLALTLANGVTGARVMWGDTAHHSWRRAIEAGRMLGPRQIIGSVIFDGPQPYWPGSVALGTADEARAAVQRAHAEGSDFIKVYSRLPRDVFFAIADEARRLGLPFAGHVPSAVTVAEVSNAGQRTIEHLTRIPFAVSSRETALRSMPTSAAPDRIGVVGVEAVRSFDEQKATALFELFLRNDTWQSPTLTAPRWRAYGNDPEFTNDARLKYVAKWLRDSWVEAPGLRGWTDETFDRQREIFAGSLRLVAAMHRAGVGLLAGTDIGNPYLYPGFSLHDELQLFVQAGLTPMEALQTATSNAARFLGKEADFGVSVGRIADLVLLEGDPLQEIRNTQKIAAVIFGGRLLHRQQLDEILAAQERWARLP
ncbi:MAG: amidohydrolase family protein [Gemmatimonadaceae bacterium]